MNTLEHLIWDEYIRINKDLDAEAGMERYPEIRFKREYTIFRQGQFTANRIFELGERTELPHNSLIHVFDNISHMTEDPQDIPRLEECPLIDRESFRKFIYHIKNFNLEGPLHYEDKFIFRQSGLPARLLKFRTQHGSRFRYPMTMEELPTRREALCIINHNPLFRARFFGRLQTFRKLTLIWTSILNTVCALKDLNKNQFIYIPWGEEVYLKNLFIKNRDKLTIATIRYPEDPHYFIMMHLVNYMWDKSTTSIFSQIPEDVLPQINLILTLNGKYLIFNLATIKELNDKNRVYYKFINLLNMLSLFGRSDEPTEETKKLLDRHFVESEVSPSSTENTGVTATIEPRASVNNQEDTVTDTVGDAIETIAKVLPNKALPTPTRSVVHAAAPVETPPLSKDDIKARSHAKVKKNVATASVNTSTNIKQEVKEYMDEGDKITEEFINNQEHLTMAQRKRYTALATKYKSLELNGKSLEKILTTEDDISLDTFAIDPKKVGDIPDKSACEASIVSFDKNYMDKSFDRHFVETITAFRKQGVFLTDIKTKHEVDRMNNFMHYTLHYEDINGKKSTVKLRVPQPTRDGRIRIDGLYSVLKKQRINLPIVKISDTEVSLSSNYNKTRVERNTNKAHNYFEYIDSLINSNRSSAQIQFGKCIINLPLPYEYAIIGEHYRSITFTKDKVTWKLWFDYKDRADQFDGKEETMLSLEKEYGTFLGSNNTQWLFIDSNCQIRAIFKNGGEDPNFQLSTLQDIFMLSLHEDATVSKKYVTEYVTIKILDKMLPIIFLLAYQYGLRNTLDYMGIKYTITETRGRAIVGESGTASYDIFTVGNEGFFDAIGKITRKLFYHLASPLAAMQRWIAQKWYKDEPEDPHLWKVSIYCVPTAEKKKWKIVSIVLTILPKAGSKFIFKLCSKFNNKIIDRDKQLFMDPLASQIASTLKVHVRNIAFAEKKIAKDGKLPTIYKNTKEITPGEISQLAQHDTMRDVYFSQVAKKQNIAGLADFNSYHITHNLETLKKYGLLSPRDMFNIDRDLFHQTTYQVYRARASVFLKKSSISDEDVLTYLDKSPKRTPLSSRSTFWSFIPSEKMPEVQHEGFELTAKLSTIKKYALGDPILVEGPDKRQVTWSEFEKEYNSNIKDAEKEAKKPVKKGYNYGKIIHFAVDSKPIPYKEFTHTTVIGEEAFNDAPSYMGPVPTAKLPVLNYEIVQPYFLQAIQEYKEHFNFDCKYLKMEMSAIPRNNRGEPTDFPVNQYGACWTWNKIIYVNPLFRDTSEFFSERKTDTYENFYKGFYRILAHEIAHEIFNNVASAAFKEQILNAAHDENFTTGYLDHYDKNRPMYKEEVFCEYLSTKLLEKSAIHENLWVPEKLYPERVKNLEVIDKNGLKEQDYFLGASAAAVLYGMPIENADLDICITRESFERLRSNWVAGEQDGVHNNMFQDKTGILDLTWNKDDDWCNFNVFWQYTVNINGYRYLSWKGLKMFYEILYNRRHKEKHKTRLEWMLAQEGESVSEVDSDSSAPLIKGISGEVPSVADEYPGAKKYTPKNGDIAIKFSDRILWFNRYPIEKSLVVSGLDYFDCSQYSLADLESKDVYYQMLTDKGFSTNYLKGISSFFDLFVDGMTYEVLKKMNEPTTFRDLLLRSAQLLSTTDHLPPASKENHRIRGFEQYNAIIYNEMSRQLAAYQSKRGKANTFSVNPDAIFLRIISNESMVAAEGTNPLQCMREAAYMTYSGIGGRSADSFVLRDRAYADDDVGIISEGTADSTKVSINAMLSMNSGIKDTLGTLDPKPKDQLQPADVLTNNCLMFPFSCNDDTKRVVF